MTWQKPCTTKYKNDKFFQDLSIIRNDKMGTHNVLVTGGAGYIGSHMVKLLSDHDFQMTVVDNLSTGFADAVPSEVLVILDLNDYSGLDDLFQRNKFNAVIHFAGSSSVGESLQNPQLYYRNNLLNSINLFDVMIKHDVLNLIFSSTAAVYGIPHHTPIDEDHPKQPINPYGFSKRMIEQILSDYSSAYGLQSISLRYFNAAGADPEGVLGERHSPETHLIPLAVKAALGKIPGLIVNGSDYPTADGTCLRDYVHVNDLCYAHLLALNHLIDGGESRTYNLGNGSGFSVLEVIQAVERVTGKTINSTFGPRRAGDPPVLVADAQRIKKDWGWEPKYHDLEEIISHTFQWELSLDGVQAKKESVAKRD